jgi:hypothetical protein
MALLETAKHFTKKYVTTSALQTFTSYLITQQKLFPWCHFKRQIKGQNREVLEFNTKLYKLATIL